MNKLSSATDEVETIDSSSVFGLPPLIRGENAADYEELLHRIRSAVKPADFIEQVRVRDVTDATWEPVRLKVHFYTLAYRALR